MASFSTEEDPRVAVEQRFEAERRQVDDWLVTVGNTLHRWEDEEELGGVDGADGIGGTGGAAAGVSLPIQYVLRVPRYDFPGPLCTEASGSGLLPFHKLLCALSYLCHRIGTLRREATHRFLPLLTAYAERHPSAVVQRQREAAAEGDAQEAFAEALPWLLDLVSLVGGLQDAVANLMCQMGALAAAQTRKNTILQASHLHCCLAAMADGCGALLRLELAAASGGPGLALAAAAYRRMLQEVRLDPHKFAGQAVQPPGSSRPGANHDDDDNDDGVDDTDANSDSGSACAVAPQTPSGSARPPPAPAVAAKRLPRQVPSDPRQLLARVDALDEQAAAVEALLGGTSGGNGAASGGIFGALLRSKVRTLEVQECCLGPHWPPVFAALMRARLATALDRLASSHAAPADLDALVDMLAAEVAHVWAQQPPRHTPSFAPGHQQQQYAAEAAAAASAQPDKKLLRAFFDLHESVPVLQIYCDVHMRPAAFLQHWLPPAVFHAAAPRDYLRKASTSSASFLSARDARLAADVRQLSLAAAAWMADMHALLGEAAAAADGCPSSETRLSALARLLTRGIGIGGALRVLACQQLSMHSPLQAKGRSPSTPAPSPPSVAGKQHLPEGHLALLTSALSLCKAVEATYESYAAEVADALPHLVTHLGANAAGAVINLQRSIGHRLKPNAAAAGGGIPGAGGGGGGFGFLSMLRGGTSKREAEVAALADAATALEEMASLLRGPASRMHLVLLGLCTDALEGCGGVVSRTDSAHLTGLLQGLQVLTSLREHVRQACDCCFLHKPLATLLPAMLSDVLNRPGAAQQLPHIAAAFADGAAMMVEGGHPEMAAEYEHRMLQSLESKLLIPLCTRLEAELWAAAPQPSVLGAGMEEGGAAGGGWHGRMAWEEDGMGGGRGAGGGGAGYHDFSTEPNAAGMRKLEQFLNNGAIGGDGGGITSGTRGGGRGSAGGAYSRDTTTSSSSSSAAAAASARAAVDPGPFLEVGRFRAVSSVIDIRHYVERRLAASFYGRAAGALHEVQSYHALCCAAQALWGLRVEPPDLPAREMEHGVDLLQVLSDIPNLVSCYALSMHTLTFLQRPSTAAAARHLHTIGPSQVAAAVRASGRSVSGVVAGRASGAVMQLLLLLKQSLSGDRLSALLLREEHLLETEQQQQQVPSPAVTPTARSAAAAAAAGRTAGVGPSAGDATGGGGGGVRHYSLEQAERLLEECGCIGEQQQQGAGGGGVAEYLRSLVTEIGNCLGLVRLLEHGAMAASNAPPQSAPLLQPRLSFGEAAAATAGGSRSGGDDGGSRSCGGDGAAVVGGAKAGCAEELGKTLDHVLRRLVDAAQQEPHFLQGVVSAVSASGVLDSATTTTTNNNNNNNNSNKQQQQQRVRQQRGDDGDAGAACSSGGNAGEAGGDGSSGPGPCPLSLLRLLCPALCLSHVEALLLSKERLGSMLRRAGARGETRRTGGGGRGGGGRGEPTWGAAAAAATAGPSEAYPRSDGGGPGRLEGRAHGGGSATGGGGNGAGDRRAIQLWNQQRQQGQQRQQAARGPAQHGGGGGGGGGGDGSGSGGSVDSDGVITDDGFALGLAFLLRVTKQESAFDRLQFFESLRARYEEERRELLATLASKSGKSATGASSSSSSPAVGLGPSWMVGGGVQAGDGEGIVELRLARVASYSQEFGVLEHTMAAARSLFRV